MCKLDFLKILDLSNNKLSGPIPSCCGVSLFASRNEESVFVEAMCNPKVLPCDEKDKNTIIMFKHGVIDLSGVLFYGPLEKKIVANGEESIVTTLLAKSPDSVLLVLKFILFMYLDLTGINLQEETNWLQLDTLLPSLSELYLEYCGLWDIYPSLQYANFNALDVLDLSNNDFVPAKLPNWIFNFSSSISAIFLSKNSLQGKLPQIFPHLQSLDSLFLDDNDLNGSILNRYQDLTGINLQDETNWLQLVKLLPSISKLYLEYCRLRDIYPSLQYANFTALNVLDLSNNDFVQAKLPNWIFNFSSGELNISSLFELQFLSFLELGNNDFSIIHYHGQYQDLTGINLQDETNWLQLVRLLPSISQLHLEYCGLQDIYPSLQYANFTALNVLDLSNNDFVQAKLPNWIFNFSSGELNISSLFELQFLSFLELGNNDFSIIHYHGQGKNSSNNLHHLDLSDNGNLKADHMLHCISNLSFLQYQDLTGINLQDETNWLQLVRLLPSISQLHLEYCELRDIYPSLQYANFTALNVLNLSNNDFVQANLPKWIFNFSSGELNISSLFELQFLSFLELGNNDFSIIHYHGQGLHFEYCGLQDIYPSLQYANFTALNVLDLSNNDFVQAKLPNWIFNFSSGELNISSLFELQFLSFLELGNNDFSIIHYHGQGKNSSNNLHHLDLLENGNLKADHMLHWISNLSFLQYQDLTGIILQVETNWLQLVRLLPFISQLYLEYCGLRDIYPSLQYAYFTALNVLDLSNNDFVQAKLPNWIFNFSSGELNISSLFELQFLSFLELGNNDFIIIHYHGQGKNSSNNLHHLDLLENGNLKADHMLHWISNLSFLQYQDLTGIILQVETNWLQLVRLLPFISQLYLEYCGLRDIYPSLQYAYFTALNVLDLSNNDFVQAKLPNWIFNFSSGELNISSLFELQFLSFLELGNNDFIIIHYHGQGKNSSNNLHHLDLLENGNLKADHMLHWISNLSFLQYQDLTGIILQVETNWLQLVRLLPFISQLYLEYCGLRDIYPSLQYAYFTALNVLDLSNNDFVQAKLPNWIFNFSSGISAIFLSKIHCKATSSNIFTLSKP
nr:receptor-like protein 39 [Arachis hypogaea]